MYIEKWWGNYMGGSDDSLTLLDYLEEKGKDTYTLSEILSDFNIHFTDVETFRGTPRVYYVDSMRVECDIIYVISIMQDLSLFVLESYKIGEVSLSALKGYGNGKSFKVTCDINELKLLVSVLTDFANNPLRYELSDMVPDEDMLEIADECREIVEELTNLTN